MFHHLFIVEKTGICIFHKCFDKCSDHINKDLFSGFFTALFDFSKEMFAEEYYDFIDLIDFGEKRFLILEDAKVFFIALVDARDSTIAGMKKLKKFKSAFLEKYQAVLNAWLGKIEEFKGTEEVLEKIEKEGDLFFGKENLLVEINNIIINTKTSNKEIKGCCLLTTTGTPHISMNVSDAILTAIIKEIEIRWKTRIENVKKVIFFYGNEEIIIMKNIRNKMILAVVFKSGVSLGMADMLMEDTIEKINALDLKIL